MLANRFRVVIKNRRMFPSNRLGGFLVASSACYRSQPTNDIPTMMNNDRELKDRPLQKKKKKKRKKKRLRAPL